MSTSPTPEVNAYAPPQADTTVAPVLPSIKSADVPTNVKIAGWLMIANAAMVLISRVVLPTSVAVGFLPAIIDLVIGASLARGNGQLRIWAMVRCVGGAVLFGGLLLSQGNTIDFVVTLVGCGALFALLVGRAGVARIAICTTLFGLFLIVNLIGVIMLAGASSALLR